MRPRALVPFLWVFVLVGCDDEFGFDDGAPPGGEPVAANPEEPGPDVLPADPPSDPAEYAATVDHRFFPLLPGSRWTYEGREDGMPKREEVRVLEEPQMILGVPCAAVVEEVFVDGELAEVTTHWFAQDSRGNVWMFGEESMEFDEGMPFRTEDSWQAGVEGARAWLFLGADPQVGDVYVGSVPGGIEHMTVLAVSASAAVPAGAFDGCLEIEETVPDDPEDQDRILYAPGVGRVSETSPDGATQLVSYGGP